MEEIGGLQGLLCSLTPNLRLDESLDLLAKGALDLTHSRHAVLATMNDELGLLEIKHGAGDAFADAAKDELLQVTIDTEQGIVSYVAATGKAFESGDVRQDPRYRKLFETTVSEVAVPVRDRFGRIRAVLNIESDLPDAYGPKDRETCLAVASLIAMVLELAEQETRAEALIQIGGALKRALTEEALIDQVTHVASTVLRFQAASIFLLDPSSDLFVLRGSTSRLRAQVDEIKYSRGEGCTGWVCDNGRPILLHNPQSDPRWRGRYVEFPSDQIASFLCVPILVRGNSIGAVRMLRRKTENRFLDNRFTETDLRLMEAIAEQVASGLENVRNVERMIRSERMIAWGELSAKSSHMIGNRVFALKGDVNEMAHLLTESTLPKDELVELQASLATNVVRVEEILQDFRDFVSATLLHRIPGDVNALVQETVTEVFPRRTRVQLDLDLTPDLPFVNMDAKKLRRAISELIENALNYIDEKASRARLCISTGLFQQDLHEAESRPAPTMVQIEIEDTGPGVDPEQKSVIFQPFFSSRVKGMGLGLSIVKGIVDAHGGQVFEAGKAGVGARFVILLPLADRP